MFFSMHQMRFVARLTHYVMWPIHPSIIYLMHIISSQLSVSESLKGSGSAVTSPSRTHASRSAAQLHPALHTPERRAATRI